MASALFKSYLQLILPEYLIITVISVIAASLLLTKTVSFILLIPIIIYSLSMMAFNTLNNLADIDIDRINKPSRPLITGSISKKDRKSVV